MGDRLVNFSTILLFGRELEDIVYNAAGDDGGSSLPQAGNVAPKTKKPKPADKNDFVDAQLAASGARFARFCLGEAMPNTWCAQRPTHCPCRKAWTGRRLEH